MSHWGLAFATDQPTNYLRLSQTQWSSVILKVWPSKFISLNHKQILGCHIINGKFLAYKLTGTQSNNSKIGAH